MKKITETLSPLAWLDKKGYDAPTCWNSDTEGPMCKAMVCKTDVTEFIKLLDLRYKAQAPTVSGANVWVWYTGDPIQIRILNSPPP